MSGLGKELLVFDTAQSNDSDNVGAYLRASDGTLLSHTDVGGKKALDVNVANDVTVTATDLDIRALTQTDEITAFQGTDPWVVSATDLDIRDLTQSDEITVFQGTDPWVVSATDLDIRDLSHAQDNVAIAQGGNTMVVNADGSINVNADIDVVNGHEKAEDSAHSSGDIGSYILAVRQDTLASSVSADGDYASLKVDSLGRLWTAASVSGDIADDAADAGNPIKVGSRALTGPLSAVSASGDRADLISDLYRRIYVNDSANIAVASSAVSIEDEAVQLDASPLAGRKEITLQNLSNQPIYIGPIGVTTANGLRVGAGGSYTAKLGQHVALYAISANATAKPVRVLQLA
jgi:hypothetical protein